MVKLKKIEIHQQINTRYKARIFNGEAAAPHSWPWMAMILKQEPNKEKNTLEWIPHCGGSVLNNKSILTAAHCIDQM